MIADVIDHNICVDICLEGHESLSLKPYWNIPIFSVWIRHTCTYNKSLALVLPAVWLDVHTCFWAKLDVSSAMDIWYFRRTKHMSQYNVLGNFSASFARLQDIRSDCNNPESSPTHRKPVRWQEHKYPQSYLIIYWMLDFGLRYDLLPFKLWMMLFVPKHSEE